MSQHETSVDTGIAGLGELSSIFDSAFNGAARSEMYRSWVCPDLFPHEKPARIENWPPEDIEMFVGKV